MAYRNIRHYRKSTAQTQPHKQRRYIWHDLPKSEWEVQGVKGYLTFTGCDCNACDAYYHAILGLNSERCAEMLGLRAIGENVHVGDPADGIEMQALLAVFGTVTVNCQFIRKADALKKLRAEQRYKRETRQKSSIRWRG